MFKPKSVNILGKTYSIEYCDNPANVDIHKRESLWGQIDYWSRSIRIYDNGRIDGDIFETIIHEVLHGIVGELKIKTISEAQDEEDVIGLLAVALSDTLRRNKWLND